MGVIGPRDKYGRYTWTDLDGKRYRSGGDHPENCDCERCLEMRESDRKYAEPYDTRVNKDPPDQDVSSSSGTTFPKRQSWKGGSSVSETSLNDIYSISDDVSKKRRSTKNR